MWKAEFLFPVLVVLSRDGELVLMDAGSEFHGYSSDITRTWPVSGKFSEPQRELYELVLRVQKKCLKVRVVSILTLRQQLLAASLSGWRTVTLSTVVLFLLRQRLFGAIDHSQMKSNLVRRLFTGRAEGPCSDQEDPRGKNNFSLGLHAVWASGS